MNGLRIAVDLVYPVQLARDEELRRIATEAHRRQAMVHAGRLAGVFNASRYDIGGYE
ncbi:MAG: hypothetical protein KGL39_37130 [Patescibacteria group bacterium]|nr:hypothetical protein [Patescibacteria group bacterium]